MTTSYVLYCDEAGNSGSNYLDLGQPYFVCAGWLVSAKGRDRTLNAFGRAGQELKGSRAVRSRTGQSTILQVFSEIRNVGALPFFSITDKRFALAEWLIATLLDPVSNPAAESIKPFAPGTWPRLVEIAAGLSDEALRRFGAAFHRPEVDALEAAIKTVGGELQEDQPELAKAVLACAPATLMEDELSPVDALKHAQLRSPNLAGFLAVVRLVDQYADSLPTQPEIRVIHDEQRQFEAPFERYLDLLGQIPFEHVDGPSLWRGVDRVGLRHVTGFTAASSDNSAHLQAADFLASSILRLMTTARAGQAWEGHLRELASVTILGVLGGSGGIKGPWPRGLVEGLIGLSRP